MSTKHKRRAILADDPAADQPAPVKLIGFGSPRRPADRCTYADAPADFTLCFDCAYNQGAKGVGILCSHRFGIDPTLVNGRPTQLQGGDIIDLA